jgi:hypothetical protein
LDADHPEKGVLFACRFTKRSDSVGGTKEIAGWRRLVKRSEHAEIQNYIGYAYRRLQQLEPAFARNRDLHGSYEHNNQVAKRMSG